MKTTAKCNICGNEFKTIDLIQVKDPITHYSYQCRRCHNIMLDYTAEVSSNSFQRLMENKGVLVENGYKTDKAKNIPVSTGIEWEVGEGVDESKHRILLKYGWARSHDCTVQAEYKSPIYRNLNGIAKLLYSVVENGSESIGEGAGTHVNVWCEELNSKDWKRIQNRYNTIFRPLYDEIMNDNNHELLFGRKANRWCRGFGLYHECLINMQDDKEAHPRIEFRICKYDNNAQFMNCLKFCNEVMKTITVNYSRNYMTDREAGNAEAATKHNNHKAEITAQKLVKVYRKYRGL